MRSSVWDVVWKGAHGEGVGWSCLPSAMYFLETTSLWGVQRHGVGLRKSLGASLGEIWRFQGSSGG
jgi:hypothetical protein